uniref:Small ribosomal subunit protein uS4c n=1 Tax=Monotropastrum sciaphilum TaxID=1223319 RepID=A0A2D3C2Z9_9ERIC|nr:ribosomal protein S4 [Monotropastrum sciaphilum]
MSRYRGPRFKKIRRLGTLPGLINKKIRIKNVFKNKFGFRKKSKYKVRLKEKQRLRFHYGLTERQLIKYFHIARKSKGPTGQILLQLLEMRLDNIIFRLGMASTIPGARQLVNHGHILVNSCKVNIPSYRCKPKDIITIRDEKKSRALIKNSLVSSPAKTFNSLSIKTKGIS